MKNNIASKIFRIITKLTIFIAAALGLLVLALYTGSLFSDQLVIKLPVAHKDTYSMEALSKADVLTPLKADGNSIVNATGERVILKGVMAPDPDRLYALEQFNRDYYQKIRDTGASVIRVPIHPERYYRDEDYLWRYLDPLVTWAGEMGLYIILDWHYIGNIKTGAGNEMPDIEEKPLDYSIAFWEKTAAYFKEAPHVLFEIYNEPASIAANDWAESAGLLIAAIRKTGAEQMIIAGGIDYAHDLSWVDQNPLQDDNLAYAAHVYPDRGTSVWPIYFGNLTQKYPVIITEWGYMDENRKDTEQKYLIGDEKSFGSRLVSYLDEKETGWVAAWYDDAWEPPMFTKGYKSLTNFGKFITENLKSN